MRMVVIIFFLYLWGGEVSCSTVYRCESELGKVTYQGLPCSKEFNRQDKLFFKTALSDVSNKSSNQKKQIKLKEKKKLAKKHANQNKLKNIKKKQKLAQKNQQKMEKKRMKQEKKCKKNTQETETIQNRLRAGYTAKQGVILQRKLKQLVDYKQANCHPEAMRG